MTTNDTRPRSRLASRTSRFAKPVDQLCPVCSGRGYGLHPSELTRDDIRGAVVVALCRNCSPYRRPLTRKTILDLIELRDARRG